MNLRDLRYLVAVADHAHFGRAAAACNISQPTLSTQVKKLEDFLGVTLFERTNKSVQITPVGAAVVARAREALAEVDAILELTRSRAVPLTGPLRLGVIPTLGPYLLPWLVPRLAEAFPRLELVIHEDLTQPLVERLRQHRIDAALVALPSADGDMDGVALFDEPFWFACAPGHRLAGAVSIGERDLEADDLLVLTDGHCLRDQALAVCRRETPGKGAAADFRATSLETIRQMVAAGMGSSLFPALAVAPGQAGGVVTRPLARPASRRIGLVWRPSYPRADDLRRLAEVVRERLPAGVVPIDDDSSRQSSRL